MLGKLQPQSMVQAQNQALNRLVKEGFNLQEQIEYWNLLREHKAFL